jgi:hypothetical protein
VKKMGGHMSNVASSHGVAVWHIVSSAEERRSKVAMPQPLHQTQTQPNLGSNFVSL